MMQENRKNNDLSQLEEMLSAVKRADSILLFSHISPDGDTIGSALALKMMLEALGKKVIYVLDGIVPPSLFFLPDIYAIRSPQDPTLEIEASKPGTLAIAVDVSCSDRMGACEALFNKAPLTAQVDHHETNPGYAHVNLIDGQAPATAILVNRLREAAQVPLAPEMAVCLYTALATDTGNFVYDSTNSEAFLLMSRLMEAGLPLARYSRLLFRRKEREFVQLLGKTLHSLTLLGNGQVAGLTLTLKDLEAVHATSEHTDGIVDYAIDIAGVQMAYFAKETEDGAIKFSLRALAPHRVDEAAAVFGGGGHQLAAGCTLRMPLDEAVALVQQALQSALEGSPKP